MRNQVKVKEYRRRNYVMSMWEYTSEKQVLWSLTCLVLEGCRSEV